MHRGDKLGSTKRSGTVLEVSTAGLVSQAFSEGKSPVPIVEPPHSIYTPVRANQNMMTESSAHDLRHVQSDYENDQMSKEAGMVLNLCNVIDKVTQ